MNNRLKVEKNSTALGSIKYQFAERPGSANEGLACPGQRPRQRPQRPLCPDKGSFPASVRPFPAHSGRDSELRVFHDLYTPPRAMPQRTQSLWARETRPKQFGHSFTISPFARPVKNCHVKEPPTWGEQSPCAASPGILSSKFSRIALFKCAATVSFKKIR